MRLAPKISREARRHDGCNWASIAFDPTDALPFLCLAPVAVLNHVLANREGLKVAVIINDMSQINIDAAIVQGQGTLSRTEEQLVEFSNGCICCTLREDLLIDPPSDPD